MKVVLLLGLVAAVLSAPAHEGEHDVVGAQVLRTNPNSVRQLSYLNAVFRSDKYDFWTEPKSVERPVDIMATRWNLPSLKTLLDRQGISYSVMISDVHQMIEQEKQSRVRGPVDWNDYHTYEEIQDWLKSLTSTYPDLTSVKSIGTSYEGREMNMLTISTGGSGKPGIFVDGGIHAREWISPAVVTYIINELLTKSSTYMDVLDKVDMHFIPSINPDGYSYTWTDYRLWRKTRKPNPGSSCYGADPNRNWEFHWNEVGASSDPCSDIFAGDMPFSEQEMVHVRDQIDAMKDSLKAYLTFHSYSQLWMYPWGFTTALPDDWQELDDLADDATKALEAVHGKHFDIGSSTNTIYAAAGGSDDWAKGTAGVKYSYTIELRDTGFYGFQLPPSQIIPSGEETFAGFEVVMNLIKDTYGKK